MSSFLELKLRGEVNNHAELLRSLRCRCVCVLPINLLCGQSVCTYGPWIRRRPGLCNESISCPRVQVETDLRVRKQAEDSTVRSSRSGHDILTVNIHDSILTFLGLGHGDSSITYRVRAWVRRFENHKSSCLLLCCVRLLWPIRATSGTMASQ